MRSGSGIGVPVPRMTICVRGDCAINRIGANRTSRARRIDSLLSDSVSSHPMFLDRQHSIAPPGFSRWRVPPAALAIHLAIGQAYAFSVFNLPLSTLVGID